MNITFNPNNSMEQFHNNENVVHLVNLCLDNMGDELIDDILILIRKSSFEKAEKYLVKMQSNYYDNGKINIFNDLKNTFLEIYSDHHVANLRGGFLELLSLKVFKNLYTINEFSFDCNVIIGGWVSPKTVDIAIKYDFEGLVSECKISQSDIDEGLLNNLLKIQEKSVNYFSSFLITLEDKRRLYLKLREIKRSENIEDLVKINIVTKNNFYKFCNGLFENYNDLNN